MRTILLVFVILMPFLRSGTPVAATSSGLVEIDGLPATALVSTHPLDGSFAVMTEAGLFVGDGHTWENVGEAVARTQVVWSGDASQIWLGAEELRCAEGGQTGDLLRSEDNGQTWKIVEEMDGFVPLAIWPGDGLALAAGCTGLMLSTDLGLTWTPIDGVPLGFDVTAFGEVLSTDGAARMVLIGLTSEGGTSYLAAIDLTNPAAPIVRPDLRTYYAIGVLAGWDATWVLGAMDGVWVSTNVGETWSRHAEGLEELVLAEDPAVAGLPEDVDPRNMGITAISPLPNGGLVVGTSDGLYSSPTIGEPFVKVPDTAGRVEHIQVNGDTGVVLYLADGAVAQATIPRDAGN